jgi:prolyl-tRNA synthetase
MGKEGKQPGVPLAAAPERIVALLEQIQADLFNRARTWRDAAIHEVNSYDEFKKRIEDGGFYLAHWDGTRETEDVIQNETKATIRCIPFDRPKEPGQCLVTGKPSEGRVILARAY